MNAGRLCKPARVPPNMSVMGSHFLRLAKSKSIGSLWLCTFARNVSARRFYEHQGFKEVERESENMYKIEAIKYKWLRGPTEA